MSLKPQTLYFFQQGILNYFILHTQFIF